MIIISELPYSLHLGSNKNRKNSVRSSAKNNISGTTSMTNNGIQNAKTLSKCDKHNYRKYDNEQEQIVIVKGTSHVVRSEKIFTFVFTSFTVNGSTLEPLVTSHVLLFSALIGS